MKNKILLYGGKSTALIVCEMLKEKSIKPSFIYDEYLFKPYFKMNCIFSNKKKDLKKLKRLPHTILTEENLKEYLNDLTGNVNFENHYWISNSFISKLGRMTPNL